MRFEFKWLLVHQLLQLASGILLQLMVADTMSISFRGEDTRNSFTDHLYEALKNAGIHTFRDSDEIRRGEELTPEIKRAIEASLASVIVLSKNYATSTWCLEELRLILEQRRDCNQFVLPIFYDADPSDVKKQNKTFMIQVKTSSMWTNYNVSRWKAALTEVANLAGLVLVGSETKLIKKIVDTVYNSVCLQQVSLPPNLIGMDTLDIEINSWLKLSDAQFLVICGMGGSGKTTLALYTVSLNWNSFENVSIIENIGSIWKEPQDLLQLQEKLLEDISGGKKRMIPSVSQGKFTIEKALQEKKALIVLDDIVETSQLVALLGSGIINKQSKIIITTRENNIGKWFESTSWRCTEYQMKLLDDGKSLELLSLHAFKSKIPMEGYEDLAKQAVQYCKGNPLALEVLGSSLFDSAGDFPEKNNKAVWESTLKLLKTDIHEGIQSVLIRSYNSLPNILTKQLFLHIACFFMGKDVDFITKILEQDYLALSGIKTLTNRCLITISPNKKLMMHRLLQEMGRHIVDQESSTLTKRSRIWRYKEACHVLKNRKGSEKVEGLALDMSMPSEDNYAHKSGLKTDSLRDMNYLKLLQLNFAELTGSYENLSENLRWLCWHGFRLRTLPSELFIGNLVALDMSYSCLEVFEPPMILQSLKILNFKGSQYLLEIHSISRLPNLETLVLWGCSSLVHVCQTLGDLTSLDLLNMTGCENLCKWNKMNTLVGPSVSVSFGGVKEHTTFSLPRSLQRFYLNGCNLECTDSFSLSFSMQPLLKYLNLGNSLFEVLPYYDHLQNLRVLDLSFCLKLKWLLSLPNTLAELYIYYCMSIEKITFQSPRFTLQEFGYRGCTNLNEIEGFIKLIPLGKLDETDMGHMKWLKEYQHLEVCLVGDDELTEDRSLFVQMLFEFDLMSISLPDIKDPNMSPDYKSESSSLSFDVPSCPKDRIQRRLKGLNLHFKYTISGNDWGWFAKITSTNGIDIMYNPKVFGRPGFGEVGIWFSYFPIGKMLEVGDKVNVSIAVMYGLVIHECGASLVYTDDEIADDNMKNNMGWEETIGGDLSGFQLSTKTYYLCRRDFYELMEVGRLTPGWLSILVGDSIDDTEVRGWRKTGPPKQLNPSFTELKTVRCIIYGPGLEETYKIAEKLKPSGFSHVPTKAVDMPETFVMNEPTKSTLASLEMKKEPATKDLLETITVEKDVSHAIGIDLGTTYSCVGVWKSDRVEIIPNIQCYRTTPSYVALSGAARLIGVKAMNQFTVNPTNTVYDVKRLIGRRFSDAKVQEDMKLWPFKVIEGPNDIPKVVVSYKGEVREFFAEEISSMVLTKLKEDAESYLGKTVKDAVITVPVYFDDSQRQATKDACDVAGINVLQIINDSTAAAIAYGLDMGTNITRETTVLIFDLGGGTFDVSLVSIDEKGKFEVKAVAGDTHLGGQDFDNILLDHVVMKFNKKTKTDISGNRKALARLRVACEKAKRNLSSTTQTSIELDYLHEGVDLHMKITREKFENLNAEIFNKCIETVESCLTDARTNKKDVNEVILIGGSTRIPKVQQLLQDFFNRKELCKTIDVDEAVAYGAAVLAAKLSGKTSEKVKDLVLLDIVPLSLSTNLQDGTLDVIIPRYTPIPAKNERTYYTTEDNQSSITVDIYQGERIMANNDNNWLGKLTIEVPPAPKGISQANVVFNIDASGILNCSAKEGTRGQIKKIIISIIKQRLSVEEIKKMKKDAEKYKFDDDEYKKLFAISALKDYISEVQFKINILGKSYEKTMNKKDMEKIEIALLDAREYVDGRKHADVYTVKKTLNQLKRIFDPILQTWSKESFAQPKTKTSKKIRS